MKSKAVKKSFGDRVVLDLPELEFKPGKIYAIMGANGCGKSTFARFAALENGIENEAVAYLPQKSFAFRMSVKRNVMLSCTSGDRADEIISRLGLSELSDSNAKKLSGGETAKLALARVLCGDHSLLILDEPTAAMDVESTFETEKLIEEYRQSRGATVILITHSAGQAERLADELLFLDKGRLCERGPAKEVINNPKTEEAKQFIAL